MKEQDWSPQYSRSFKVVEVKFNGEISEWREGQPRLEWIALMRIQNSRDDVVAMNCTAHLKSIQRADGTTVDLMDKFPIKCCKVASYTHTVWPNSSVEFDLLSVEKDSTRVYLHTQHDVLTNGSRAPILSEPGIYALQYEIYAEYFPVTTVDVELGLGIGFDSKNL